jgi:hypothetical protein
MWRHPGTFVPTGGTAVIAMAGKSGGSVKSTGTDNTLTVESTIDAARQLIFTPAFRRLAPATG